MLRETGTAAPRLAKGKGRVMIPPTIDLPLAFRPALITSTAFDQAYQSAIAFGTANLPQIAPDSPPALIPIGCPSPASIKIPDDRITHELHDQKQCNSRSNRHGKVEKFMNMHSFTPNLYSGHLDLYY